LVTGLHPAEMACLTDSKMAHTLAQALGPLLGLLVGSRFRKQTLLWMHLQCATQRTLGALLPQGTRGADKTEGEDFGAVDANLVF
jgi:hypothetical protein